MHVHSIYSTVKWKGIENFNTVDRIRQAVRKAGIDGVGIMDHDYLEGAKKVGKKLKRYGIFVFPGVEITTKEGHIIAYGLNEDIPMKLPLKEAIDRVREQGAIVVIPHPFFPYRGITFHTFRIKADVIETCNASSSAVTDKLADWYANKKNLPKVAGSDAHYPKMIGRAYIEVNCEPDVDAVLHEILKKRTKIHCGRTSLKEKFYFAAHHFINPWKGLYEDDVVLVPEEKII